MRYEIANTTGCRCPECGCFPGQYHSPDCPAAVEGPEPETVAPDPGAVIEKGTEGEAAPDLETDKERARIELEQLTAAYLEAGGVIKRVPLGVSGGKKRKKRKS